MKKRGELMAQARNGGMAAVMGIEGAAVQRLLDAGGIAGVTVANFNAPTQTVISGTRDGIDRLEDPFTAANAVYIKLNVSGAFHTEWMRPAQDEFTAFLSGFAFHAPAMPVISNLRAEPYTRETVVDNLLHQISSPVRWTEVVGYLLAAGADEIVEVGPGRVLTGLIDKIRRSR